MCRHARLIFEETLCAPHVATAYIFIDTCACSSVGKSNMGGTDSLCPPNHPMSASSECSFLTLSDDDDFVYQMDKLINDLEAIDYAEACGIPAYVCVRPAGFKKRILNKLYDPLTYDLCDHDPWFRPLMVDTVAEVTAAVVTRNIFERVVHNACKAERRVDRMDTFMVKYTTRERVRDEERYQAWLRHRYFVRLRAQFKHAHREHLRREKALRTVLVPTVAFKPQCVTHREKRIVRALSHRLVRNVALQSGQKEKEDKQKAFKAFKRREAREAADQQQRDAAAARKKAEYKSKSKAERERDVKSNRDKRNPAFQSGGKLGVAVGAAAALLASKLYSLLGKTGRVVDRVYDLTSSLKSMAEKLKEAFGSMLWQVPFCMVAFFAARSYIGVSQALVLTLLCGFVKIVGPQVWARISGFFPVRDVVLQSAEDLFSTASKLLATFFTFSMLKGYKGSIITEMLKRIGSLKRIGEGWEVFINWSMQALEACVNLVRRCFGKERITLLKSAHTPFRDWCKLVDDMVFKESTTVEPTTAKLKDMMQLLQRGYEFKEIYRGTTMSRSVEEYCLKLITCIQPYQGALSASGNFRFEPVSMFLYGLPGIGKTLIAPMLCVAIMKESGLVPKEATMDDVLKEIFQKGTSKFWNGYCYQLCLVMDDAFQLRAYPGFDDHDSMTLIRAVTSWLFPLDFADLASKGKINFGSKFIYGTTNLKCIDSELRTLIQEPEAVSRRMHFPYSMRVRKEFTLDDGVKLDYAKFSKELKRAAEEEVPIDRFPWFIWEAARHDFLTGVTSDKWEPFKDVVLDVAGSIKSRVASHVDAKASLADFCDGYMKFQSGTTNEEERDSYLDHILRDRACGSKPNRNLYDMLKLDSEAEFDDVIPTFRRVIRLIHPDKNGGDERCTRATQLLLDALDVHLGRGRTTVFEEQDGEERSFGKYVEIVRKGTMILAALGAGWFLGKAILSIVNGMWDMIRNFFGRSPTDLDKKGNVKFQSNRPNTPRNRNMNPARLQSGAYAVPNIIYNNTYKMYAREVDGLPRIIGQVIFFMSTLAAVPDHFFGVLENFVADGTISPESKLTFVSAANPSLDVEVPVHKFLAYRRKCYENMEVTFVEFKDIRSHHNIVGNTMCESDIKHLRGRICTLRVMEMKFEDPRAKPKTRPFPHSGKIVDGKSLRLSGRRVDRYFEYPEIRTFNGYCGAPLCIDDNSLFSGRTLIGMHVAGCETSAGGYSAIITKEMVQSAAKHFETIEDKFAEDLTERGVAWQASALPCFEDMGSFLPIGRVDKPINLSPATSYFKTPLYGSLGPYTHQPAKLGKVFKDGEVIYPMKNAVKPYSSRVEAYDETNFELATHVAMSKFTALTEHFPKRIYTFEEAVKGIPQEKFRSIPRGTSAGFPYIYDVRNGKKEFFGEDDEYDLLRPSAVELKGRTYYVISSAEEGIRLAHVFNDFMKDELRPIEKVDACATRLISSAPLDYTVVVRMYFGAFCAAMMRVNVLSGCAPGMCAYTDWTKLATFLSQKGEHCFDGDFKAFDSSEQPSLHEHLLNFINAWYDDGPVNARVRRVLWMDLTHSRHIGGPGDNQVFLYQWNKSLPSGHPLTTVVNSMYSLVLLVLAYIEATGDLTGFWNHVHAVTYGDDNVVNVDDIVAPIYNQEVVANVLKRKFNVIYTPSNKAGELERTKPITSLSFLKRGFALRNNTWLCPLEKESFLYTVYWSKNRKEMTNIMHDVLEIALQELSMHDSAQWDDYAPKIAQLLKGLGHQTQAPLKQAQYLRVVQARTDVWY